MTYLFYDIETTGLNKAFDQILRFAAIRTDERLREIDRHLLKVRLRDDVIPSPAALVTHRISLENARDGLREVEAIRQIHDLMNTPGTISLGYNTLGFDDEFLRFSFYRNLLPPYTHQWKNECGRMDVYPMTIVYRLLESGLLEWPADSGHATLRLEHLSAANDLMDGRAHTAMADTEATVELARRLASNRSLWNELHDHFDKQLDRGRYDRLPKVSIGSRDYRVGILVSGLFGEEHKYQRPVICLGQHRTYSNQARLLILDTPELHDTSKDEITEVADVAHKKFGIPDFLFSSDETAITNLSTERRRLANETIVRLKKEPGLLEAIADHYLTHTYPDRPEVDVDAALYQSGFWDNAAEERCAAFHAAGEIKHKLAAVSRFERKDLQQLARRVLIRNFHDKDRSDSLASYQDEYWQRMFPGEEKRVPVDYRERNRRTPRHALQELVELREEGGLDREQEELLAELEAYINAQFVD